MVISTLQNNSGKLPEFFVLSHLPPAPPIFTHIQITVIQSFYELIYLTHKNRYRAKKVNI